MFLSELPILERLAVKKILGGLVGGNRDVRVREIREEPQVIRLKIDVVVKPPLDYIELKLVL